MNLDHKIGDAQKLVSTVLDHYNNPVVMSSFGKDSMVLLAILEQMKVSLPIVFHREPFCPKKFEFAERIIRERNYIVYDYPPMATSVIKNGAKIEIISWYGIGKRTAYVPTGIREPEQSKPWLCGYRDLYLKPTGALNFPWDVGFVGHKSTDVDPILGSVPLAVDIKVNDEACDYAFPLRHFTDADVWTYTERFGVPFNEKRYDRANGYAEFSDITWNNDYYHACTRCIDRDAPATVFCPLFERDINNISAQVRYTELERLDYLCAADSR